MTDQLPQLGPSLQGPPLQPLPPPDQQPLPTPGLPQNSGGPVVVQMMTGMDMSPYLKLVIFGGSGTGKTRFAATAPKPFFIDTQGGTKTLRDWPELLAKVNIARVPEWRFFPPTIAAIKRRDHDLTRDRETFVLDTIDSLQRSNLRAILNAKQGGNKFLPMEHEYKQSGEMLIRLILELRDLEAHVIILMDQTVINDPAEEGRPARYEIRPGVTPKLAKTLVEEFDLVGYLQLNRDQEKFQNIHNILTTQSSDVMWHPKSRFRHLPTQLGNPTFDDLLKAANLYKEQPK